jgi:hypothetical protein
MVGAVVELGVTPLDPACTSAGLISCFSVQATNKSTIMKNATRINIVPVLMCFVILIPPHILNVLRISKSY